MLDLYADTLFNNNLLELLSERGRNRVVKEALRAGVVFFHLKIQPLHFTKEGQSRYPKGTFISPKTWRGDAPLVNSGEFRDRILSQKNIVATFRRANIKYHFGRPSYSYSVKFGNLEKYRENKIIKFTEDLKKTNPRDMDSKSRNRIFHYMKGKKIKFEEARKQIISSIQKKVYKSTSYGKITKKRMVIGVSAINAEDKKNIVNEMQDFVNSNWQKLGKANIKVNK